MKNENAKKAFGLSGYSDAQAKAICKMVSAQMGLSPEEMEKINAREQEKNTLTPLDDGKTEGHL